MTPLLTLIQDAAANSRPPQATGTWQGIYYLEFRAAKHTRKVMATIQGEKYQ